MKTLVTGAYGQLGGELCRRLGPRAIPIDIDTLDLTDGPAVAARVRELRPAAVINCAAYTLVDKAETEPAKCRAVNAVAVEHLARACGEADCPLVQISTDYVFGAAAAGAAALDRAGPSRRRKACMPERSSRASGRRPAIRNT